MNFLSEINKYIQKEIETLQKLNLEEINTCINVIYETYENNGNIYIFGNGGSGSTASHFACDFNKGLNEYLPKKFNFICLNDNIPTVLAIANDISYDEIFRFQLKDKLQNNDLIIAISGSGNSINIIKAIEYAKEKQVKTIGITGFDGGKLREIADYTINVNIDDMQISEDIHLIINHLMYKVLFNTLIKNS